LIGKTISHYKIIEKLGEGGMGVVYKAEDTKLKRLVAIKFLPRQIAASAEERERFKIEAQAAAALNHPNIATIHAIEEHEDEMFIVMEYIEGKELRDVIGRGEVTSPLPVGDILNYATQIAEGLKAAHAKGIIHRDIKSSNIMVTNEGQAKIMDFGLAKIGGGVSLTKTGTTVGTLAYMSPEQLQGANVDHRTDIWSFGVVLYEMITGRLPFPAEYEAALSNSITNEQPEPLARYKAGVSDGLQRIVDKALDKDRETRYQHVDDLLADIKREKKSSSAAVSSVAVKKSKPRHAFVLTAAFALVAILVIFITVNLLQKQPATPVAAQHRQVTFEGNVYLASNLELTSLSPDGQFLAYVIPKDSLYCVMVRDLTGSQPIEVFSGFVYLSYLRWSPDGTKLLCSANMPNKASHIYVMPRLGGKPQKLAKTISLSACWSPDGSQIASIKASLQAITYFDTASGDTLNMIRLHGFHWLFDLDWSPVGDRLVFLTSNEQQRPYTIWTVKADGAQQQKVVEGADRQSSPRWSRDGKAVYYLRGNGQTSDLMKIAVSSTDGTPKGEPEILQTGLNAYGFELSGDNKKLAYTKLLEYSNLWSVTVEGEGKTQKLQTQKLTRGTSYFIWPAFSPDGRNVAFVTHPGQIFVMSSEGGDMQQITFLNSGGVAPCWSPDGKELAFIYDMKIWRIPAEGGTPLEFQKTKAGGENLSWSPSADILYQRPGNQNFHFLDPQTEKERPLVANDSVGWISSPRYSPDGKKVAVFWNRKVEGPGLWLISLEDSSQTLLQRGRLFPIQWPVNGTSIYAWSDDERPIKIWMIPVNGGAAKVFVTLPFENIRSITMTPDGKRIICSVEESISDVWLMENFDPEVE